MSRLGAYELTHPESLSEHQLREILRNSCIDILKFEKLCRSELLEMYKRVAMPLPQREREYHDSNTIDTIPEKSITAVSNDTHSLGLSKGNKRISPTSHSQTDKLKSSLNDQNKKIRLCSISKVENECNGICKRSCEEQSEETQTKKRQKITWP